MMEHLKKYMNLFPLKRKKPDKSLNQIDLPTLVLNLFLNLMKNNKNIDEVTFVIGYENSSTFRKLFKKHVGITPSSYRDKFSSP